MYYYIVNQCDVRLWGVSQQERFRKTMLKLGRFKLIDQLDNIDPEEKVLLVRADYLLDANVLGKLMQHPKAMLTDSSRQVIAAAWIDGRQANEFAAFSELTLDYESNAIPVFTPQELTGGYDPRLRKFDLSHVVNISRP